MLIVTAAAVPDRSSSLTRRANAAAVGHSMRMTLFVAESAVVGHYDHRMDRERQQVRPVIACRQAMDVQTLAAYAMRQFADYSAVASMQHSMVACPEAASGRSYTVVVQRRQDVVERIQAVLTNSQEWVVDASTPTMTTTSALAASAKRRRPCLTYHDARRDEAELRRPAAVHTDRNNSDPDRRSRAAALRSDRVSDQAHLGLSTTETTTMRTLTHRSVRRSFSFLTFSVFQRTQPNRRNYDRVRDILDREDIFDNVVAVDSRPPTIRPYLC